MGSQEVVLDRNPLHFKITHMYRSDKSILSLPDDLIPAPASRNVALNDLLEDARLYPKEIG